MIACCAPRRQVRRAIWWPVIVRWFAPLVLVLAWPLAHARGDEGYCLSTTDPPARCGDPCVLTGAPLYWSEREIAYAFNPQRGFPELSDDEMRAIFASAFSAWEQVSCDDESLGFSFHAEHMEQSLGVGPKDTEPNHNMVWLPDDAEWDALDYDPAAFAITMNWYVDTGAEAGRMRGWDMTFNPAMGPWLRCDGDFCSDGNDLLNVATHEIGHALGLAHSNVSGSTMWCSANFGETEKRTLEAVDVEGLCALYGPDGVRPEGYDPTPDPGCACQVPTGQRRGPFAGLALGMLGVLASRWRRRLSRARVLARPGTR